MLTSEIHKEALDFACRITHVAQRDIINGYRFPRVVKARWLCAKYIREVYKLSYPRIGRIMGMHHTSIMHGCERIQDEWDNTIGNE